MMDFEFDIVPADDLTRDDVLAILDTENPGGLSDLIPGARVSQLVLLQESSIDYVPIVISVALSVPSGVASSLVASWLTNLLRGKAKAIVVDRTTIEMDEGKITRIVHEHIDMPNE